MADYQFDQVCEGQYGYWLLKAKNMKGVKSIDLIEIRETWKKRNGGKLGTFQDNEGVRMEAK